LLNGVWNGGVFSRTDVVMTSSGLDENDFTQHTGLEQHTTTEMPEIGAGESVGENATVVDDMMVRKLTPSRDFCCQGFK
jgi:hypothetical protein